MRSSKARRASASSRGSKRSRQRKTGAQVEGEGTSNTAELPVTSSVRDALKAALVEVMFFECHGEPSGKFEATMGKVRAAVQACAQV